MKILVTGASGLLGGKIAEINQTRHQIISGYNQHVTKYGKPVKLDITKEGDIQQILNEHIFDAVVHCAALTNVDLCERNPEQAKEINVQGTRNIVEQCKEHDIYLVYVSTDYVFDGEKGDYLETDTPNPINTYGKTKLQAEKIVQKTDLNYCIARTCVVYGAQPAAGKENFALWVLKNLKNNRRINIITDQIITPTYNYNLAKMISEVTEKKLTGVYHLAGATRLNRYMFTKYLAAEFDENLDLIIPVDSSAMNWVAKRPKDSALNTDKASLTLNHKPMDIQESLKQLHMEIGGN
jgi:dTDP-4-dehydrorhamnose reductase